MLVRVLVVVLVLLGLGLAVRFYMDRGAEDRLMPDEHVDIRELRDPLPDNTFLACPPDYCAATAALSPIFALPAERLSQLWVQLMAGEPRVVVVADEPQPRRVVVIQHTPMLRFPDIVTVEFVALAADQSSLAIYSRARYGGGDFGTNRRRVLDWLSQLDQLAGQ
jgi:uncharacterized protein (DUF1499 family)